MVLGSLEVLGSAVRILSIGRHAAKDNMSGGCKFCVNPLPIVKEVLVHIFKLSTIIICFTDFI